MRLIDADKLIEDLKYIASSPFNCDTCDQKGSKTCIQCVTDWALSKAPTIDPVKHGRWIGMNSCYADKYETLFFYQCSECQQEVDEYGIDNYCSHCGARMDGEKK